MVATLAKNVSTLQSALDGVIAPGNGETSTPAPAGDLTEAISAMLDDKIGVDEHPAEVEESVPDSGEGDPSEGDPEMVPATGLYARVARVEQRVEHMIGGQRSVAGLQVMPYINKLAEDNPIPFEWKEAIMEVMLNELVDHGKVTSLLRSMAAWTRYDRTGGSKDADHVNWYGAGSLRDDGTIFLVRGTTELGQPIVACATVTMFTDQGSRPYKMAAGLLDGTNLLGLYIDYTMSNAGVINILELAMRGVRRISSITELFILTPAGYTYGSDNPMSSYVQDLLGPTPEFSYGPDADLDRKNRAMANIAIRHIDRVIIKTMTVNTNDMDYALIQYHSPNETEFWYPIPEGATTLLQLMSTPPVPNPGQAEAPAE
jgi:hypothetical protein